MSDMKFVFQDLNAIKQQKDMHISVQVVSEFSPPTYPHNADTCDAWCYSIFYVHAIDSECFHYVKAINSLYASNAKEHYDQILYLVN